MRKLAHADCVVKIIHLFRHKAQSGQREILFPDIFPRLLNWVMDFLLQITSKVFQFIELAHQLCLYNTPERLAVFFTFVPILQFVIQRADHRAAAPEQEIHNPRLILADELLGKAHVFFQIGPILIGNQY